MKRSVRWKFTIIFAGLMTVAIALIWCINNWFLSGYYQNYKIHTLEKGYRAIDAIIQDEVRNGESSLEDAQAELNSGWKEYQKSKDGSSDIDSADGGSAQSGKNGTGDRAGDETQDALGEYAEGDTVVLEDDSEDASADALDGEEASSGGVRLANVIRELRDRSNISLLLYDSESDQTLVSSARDVEVMRDRVRRYIVGHAGAKRDVLREYDNYMIQKTFDPLSKTFYLESWGFFSDNATIFIMTMESIHESAAISNRFLMFVGIVVILAGSILIYFITRHITMPIKRLSELSEKMSNLDFDARYETSRRSTEEIDTLGNSMNVLSERLKTTIGELKEANAQLKKDIDEKVQIDEMRKEFIANVSHELKTPIALIQGYAEGLVEGMAEDKENRDYYCGVIMDEAGKMNRMVRQLLTLTALEFGGERLSVERFDLTELIASVISSSGVLLKQNELTVDFDGKEPVYVMGDEFKIEEVITNYLTNAIHHVGGGEKKIQIRIDHRRDGKEVCVEVFNTGNPIPDEALPNLWTKFYKVDKARTREYGGSGIGLSIVKAIMEMHHKACGVKNHENGVEFWFTLDTAGEK